MSRLLPLLLCSSACVVEYAGFVAKEEEPIEPVDTDLAASIPPDPPAEAVEQPPAEEPPVVETDPPAMDTAVPTDDPPPPDDCVGTSDLVYLVSRSDDGLYLFDPTTLQHTRLGTLDCAAFGDPQSMALARDGVGYVRWSDDRVFEVDLATLDCSPTGYAPGAFGAFGMGFATDHAGTWRDQLYVANFERLASLDRGTWRRRVLGPMPSQSELTGTSTGELWAFLPLERPARLEEIDKVTGATVRGMTLPGFPAPVDIDAFAFAHWGGSFYLFVRTFGVGQSSDVYHVSAQGVMTRVRTRMGIDVVGAGTSTCAPAATP